MMNRLKGAAANAWLAVLLSQGCAAADGAPDVMEQDDAVSTTQSPLRARPGASADAARDAEPAPPMFAYHAWADEVYVVMAAPGCYEVHASRGTCEDCSTQVTVERTEQCASPSTTVRAKVASRAGVIVMNPVKNTKPADQAICDAELGFLRRLAVTEEDFRWAQDRNYAPWYREHATDRTATTDVLACAEAAPRLRAAFYSL